MSDRSLTENSKLARTPSNAASRLHEYAFPCAGWRRFSGVICMFCAQMTLQPQLLRQPLRPNRLGHVTTFFARWPRQQQ